MAKDNLAGIIVIIVIIGLFLYNQGDIPAFTTTMPTIDFAGFTWQPVSNCGGLSVSKDSEGFLNVNVENGNGYVEADVTNIDEILVIYDGYLEASCGGSSGANAGVGIGGSISGSEGGGGTGSGVGASTSRCQDSIGDTATKYVEPAIWKFRNNFDGTWSSLQSIGVGDVFIVKGTGEVKGNAKLRITGSGSAPSPCGNQEDTWSKSRIKIYNVVVKENAFAVCKADEFWQDKNQDGTPTIDECFDLATIVLNSEEAIKESFDAKLARIELELLKKNQGLTEEIERLRQLQNTTAQQQKLTDIQEELDGTQLLLKELQDRNNELLELIRNNEQISVINQTIVVIQPTITTINQTKIIVKEPLIVAEEKKEGIPTALKVLGGIAGIIFLLRFI